MTLSARNRIAGEVTDVESDQTTAIVTIQSASGEELVATITAGSVDRLGLQVGDEVEAVVKATDVLVEK